MTERLAPGVYIEEVQFASSPIQGVSTSTVGFVAVTGRGPVLGPLFSFLDFERVATPNLGANLPLAVRGFFENSGQQCFISQIAATDPLETGLVALDARAISIICCPDDPTIQNSAAVMAAHCEQRKDRICILQSAQPIVPVAAHQPPVHSTYATYYYPWITVMSLDGSSTVTIPPSGHVAGVYAQTDSARGVWSAPANVQLVGVAALSQDLTASESDALNSRGVDVIRTFPAQGIRVWGSRTTTNQDSDYKYVSVRRFMIFLEQSIAKGLQWAVFETNGPRLWAVIRSSIENFLRSVWKQGALQGLTQQEAFFVRCDLTTMTQNDLDNGRLVCIVGVAPVAPAEFVIMQIGIWTECTPKLSSH
ncbi:MAG TPA: phage tail sheath subtilisin-like domain-containing protein [Candidatus Sulfotelmatobacter sp.]|nr:phage tail sheath subtilisin-like domain-containing protein [Candidatus Sulfotelmatobacter sp.]